MGRERMTFSLSPRYVELIESRRDRKQYETYSEALRDILDEYVSEKNNVDRELAIMKTVESIQSSLTLMTRTLVRMEDQIVQTIKTAQRNNPDILIIQRTLRNLEDIVRNLHVVQRTEVRAEHLPSSVQNVSAKPKSSELSNGAEGWLDALGME